jgi:site-specific DNA recombinase
LGHSHRYCHVRSVVRHPQYRTLPLSATDDRRPDFQRMIDAATTRPPAFDVILVHSFSRFFRDQFQWRASVDETDNYASAGAL